MIRPSKILAQVAEEFYRQATESAVVCLGILAVALVSKHVEDRVERHLEARAQADAEIETPTQQGREGEVVQQPTTAAELADGGSPSDPPPVAATIPKVAGHSPVVVASHRPRR